MSADLNALRACPEVVCLCGSTRFPAALDLANMHLTLLGKVVIGLGMYGHADQPQGARFLTSDGDEATPEKVALDELHKRKIDLADSIFVVNPGGYVGSSTRSEIEYAETQGKLVRYLFPPDAADGLPTERERALEGALRRIAEADDLYYIPTAVPGIGMPASQLARAALTPTKEVPGA